MRSQDDFLFTSRLYQDLQRQFLDPVTRRESVLKCVQRPARLAAHLRSHSNDRAFKCPYEGCDKDYFEQKHLKQHIKSSHTQDRGYQCQEEGCGKTFVTATRLRRHATVHEGAERYRCRGYEGCTKSFRKKATLDRHVRGDHLGLAKFPCGHGSCGEGFDTPAALRRHVTREHGEICYWCEDCEERDENGEVTSQVGFTTLFMLQAHMRKDHVQCVFCPEAKLAGQFELTRHMDMYHSGKTVEDRKTVLCEWPGCLASFVRVGNRNVHVKTVHQGLRFVCGATDVSEHEAELASWNGEEEGCQCGFTSLAKLVEHVKYVHLGHKRPKVHTLSLRGDDLKDLVGVSRYKAACTIDGCDARFVRNHELNLHVQFDHQLDPFTKDAISQTDVRNLQSSEPAQAQGSQGQEDMLHPAGVYKEGANDSVLPLDPVLGMTSASGATSHQEWADMQRLID